MGRHDLSPCGRVLLNSASPDFKMIGRDDFGGSVNIALVE